MGQVYTGASMSLDGYIAGPQETGFDHLFRWYGNGAAEDGKPQMSMHLDIQVDDLEEAVAYAVDVGGEVASYQPQEAVRCAAAMSTWPTGTSPCAAPPPRCRAASSPRANHASGR